MKFNKGNEEMAKWNIWKKITETISKSKAWLDGQSNAVKVLCAGAMSVIIFVLTYFVAIKNSNSNSNSVGYWNFIILIVSAPVAFVIWHFRDENNRQQIENQRKDINLKEFQKLSEWVSGAHLPEIKTVSKTTQKSSLKDGAEITEQPTEQSEEYAKKLDAANFDTFSKRDGAVALQISAIYNLLPFFRGDYGESFRLPAFNLLKSAWQAMQQDSLKKLDEGHLFDLEREEIFEELRQKARSPIGVALTHVLLSLNQENTKPNLQDFHEMLPNICLAGINFHLSGVSEIARDLSDLNLNGADFRGAILRETKFQNSKLRRAKLNDAELIEVNLQNADLLLANLQGAGLRRANLQGADLRLVNFQGARLLSANLQSAELKMARLSNVNLANVDLQAASFDWEQLKASKELSGVRITVNDFISKIYSDWKKENDPEWEALTNEKQTKAMQQFCDETKMLILNEYGTQQIIPPL
ncbi:hypothetical protein HMPREF2572_06985 [Neisseria sp. HMSC064E01]|nr:hypothetical protein HMPREF2572_06985 [Neisseria sp. HMSC064E01]